MHRMGALLSFHLQLHHSGRMARVRQELLQHVGGFQLQRAGTQAGVAGYVRRFVHVPFHQQPMELCAQVSDVLGVSVCKNLFLCNRQQTQFYLLCMSPDKVFHTKELSAQINSARLSFAPEDKFPLRAGVMKDG